MGSEEAPNTRLSLLPTLHSDTTTIYGLNLLMLISCCPSSMLCHTNTRSPRIPVLPSSPGSNPPEMSTHSLICLLPSLSYSALEQVTRKHTDIQSDTHIVIPSKWAHDIGKGGLGNCR